jgi:hypothetical protein
MIPPQPLDCGRSPLDGQELTTAVITAVRADDTDDTEDEWCFAATSRVVD